MRGPEFRSERGGIFGKSLILIILVFAVFAVVVIDGGSIFFASLHLQDVADQGAQAAAASYAATHNVQTAEAAAETAIKGLQSGAWLEKGSLTVSSDGSVTLTVDQVASTIFLKHIGPLSKYATVHVSSTQSPPSG